MYLQDLHLGPFPPKIGVKNKNVSISPMPSMLLNCLYPHYPLW